MAEAICSGVFITWRAEGKPFLPVCGGRRSGGKASGRPEDYIRSTRKRNIERNLIMSTERARARFRSTYVARTFIHHRAEASASGKRFSGRCGKQSPRGTPENWETRLRVGRWEIIFSGFLASRPTRWDKRSRWSFVVSSDWENRVHCEILKGSCAKVYLLNK